MSRIGVAKIQRESFGMCKAVLATSQNLRCCPLPTIHCTGFLPPGLPKLYLFQDGMSSPPKGLEQELQHGTRSTCCAKQLPRFPAHLCNPQATFEHHPNVGPLRAPVSYIAGPWVATSRLMGQSATYNWAYRTTCSSGNLYKTS